MSFKTKIITRYKIVASEKWFHGRNVKDQTFNEDFTGNGKDQNGPGFYFTNNQDDASSYAYPSGIVMEVTLHPRKLVTGPNSPKFKKEYQELIERAENYEDKLMDYDENPKIAMQKALEGALNKNRNPLASDGFQQIWIDFYRYRPADYLRNMVKLGYDGHEPDPSSRPLANGVKHIVIYNPKVIKVQEVLDK